MKTPPINLSKKAAKRWKTSPPPGKGFPLQCRRPNTTGGKSIPLQHCRPNTSAPSLELREPSPVHLRYDEASRFPFKVAVKPRYPTQELLDYAEPSQTRATTQQRPLTKFGLFSFVVLAVASLHLIQSAPFLQLWATNWIGPHFSNSGQQTGLNIFLADKSSFLRSSRRMLATGQKPRTVFLAESFRPASGRKVVLYPAAFSDVTQLYDTKSSDDVAIARTIERKFFPKHETNEDCVPMSPWQTMSFPTCNSLHEMGFVLSLQDSSLRLLSGAGSWRDAWRFKAYVALSKGRRTLDEVVIKTIKLQHTLQERYFEFSRVDALAMERLTPSPYIMSIHGFCGVSVVTERGIDDVAHVVNHLSPRKKVDVARKVAKSIAAVHEVDGVGSAVSLVHNDINAGNIFWGRKNSPLLNDFNIAVLMMKDRHNGTSCSFPGHFPNPQWKSPEEQAGRDGNSVGELNEKVDIYSLGNLLFQFATGHGPWRDMAATRGARLTDEQKIRIAQLKVDEGKIPNVPEETLKLKDPYIGILLEAMEFCYRFKPEDRPTARKVAEFLEKSKEWVDRENTEFGRLMK